MFTALTTAVQKCVTSVATFIKKVLSRIRDYFNFTRGFVRGLFTFLRNKGRVHPIAKIMFGYAFWAYVSSSFVSRLLFITGALLGVPIIYTALFAIVLCASFWGIMTARAIEKAFNQIADEAAADFSNPEILTALN
jgi:hypothetical protein